MIGGLVTKLLGFLIRIIYTRMVGSDAINLYSLVMPTYSLLLTIATLSLPIVISKLISEGRKRSVKILASATFITLILNIVVIIIIYFIYFQLPLFPPAMLFYKASYSQQNP